ncbi:MAG: multidrug effflux MFS transporter [Hyphomicrobiales bacterium]|nr:multidrug effflux MFS transporter [Hyphomicrobiales bacterium]
MSMGRAALVVGLLAAIGPVAIDMYLPAMPTIAADLHTSARATQATLTSFFLAFGLTQVVYGPAADRFGRRPPMFVGLGLYMLGALGAAVSPTIGWLVAARLVQGVGAASTMVIPRAIIRDMYVGVEATRMMGFIMLVISVSPILAPALGGGLITLLGWRSVFVAVLSAATAALFLVAFVLPETLDPRLRAPLDARSIARTYGELLRDRRFLGLTFIGGAGMSGFFAFLATSPFLYVGHYGFTANQFALAFGFNAAGFIGASQFAAPLAERFGLAYVVRVAVAGFAAFACATALWTLVGADWVGVLIASLAATFACLGLVIGPTMVLALDEQGERAGAASALGGALQMVAGMATIGVVSLLPKGDPRFMALAIAACALFAAALTAGTLGGMRRAIAAPTAGGSP